MLSGKPQRRRRLADAQRTKTLESYKKPDGTEDTVTIKKLCRGEMSEGIFKQDCEAWIGDYSTATKEEEKRTSDLAAQAEDAETAAKVVVN